MAEFVHVYNDGGGIRNVSMREGATRLTTDRSLSQCGIPFGIFPGDGGSNGLSFTGTRGVFTLSAALLTNAYLLFASGGYIYLPAGAGGLATDGLYWCVMTTDTDGEIFTQKHDPAAASPLFISTPTAHPNLTAGTITQSTSEITFESFILPGGSMGPNGVFFSKLFWMTNATGTKSVRVKAGSDNWIAMSLSSSSLIGVFPSTRQNCGIETRQVGNRTGSATGAWDSGTSANAVSGNFTTTDTRVDKTIAVTGQISTNTTFLIVIPMSFIIQHGA